MAAPFHVTIARIGERLFEGEATMLVAPGAEGVFTVFARHEPLIAELKPGSVEVNAANGEKFHFDLATGGLAEISNNQATLLL